MPYDPSAIRELAPLAASRAAHARAARAKLIVGLREFWAAGFDTARWEAELAPLYASEDGNAGSLAKFAGGHGSINQIMTPGVEPQAYALLACDGSQIMPDRHGSAIFAMIQAACVCVVYGDRPTPRDKALEEAMAGALKRTTMLYGEDELIEHGELVSAGSISTERDLREIELLAENCARLTAAGVRVVALADGSLMPFALLNDKLALPEAMRHADRMTRALNTLRGCNAIVAGYVDRPNSNTLVKSLALGMRGAADAQRTLAAVETLFDRQVVEGVLAPNQRTAMFDPGWNTRGIRRIADGGHALLACYANMSRNPQKPYVARIELPHWCADDLPALHALLQRHARASIGDPYPFCLKAAHENAVITKEDQREIQQSVERELMKHGIMPVTSAKQAAKDLR